MNDLDELDDFYGRNDNVNVNVNADADFNADADADFNINDNANTNGSSHGSHDNTMISRRDLLIVGALSATALSVPALAQTSAAAESAASPGLTAVLANVSFNVNGQLQEFDFDTRTTLLDALREHMQLTGTKKGCDHGQCGACTVIADGRRINACLSLAVMHQGSHITTIEGLGSVGKLHPMQAAFIKHDGFQCGYCTPGQICSAISVLDEIKQGMPSHVSADLMAPVALSGDEIRERMSGNICRCAAYPNIVEAITEVAGRPA